MTVIDEIAAERKRQIEVEGWTPEHDDHHVRGELAFAAAAYVTNAAATKGVDGVVRWLWPFDVARLKPKGARRDLIRAAALIIAEIERFDRDVVHCTAADKATEGDDIPQPIWRFERPLVRRPKIDKAMGALQSRFGVEVFDMGCEPKPYSRPSSQGKTLDRK